MTDDLPFKIVRSHDHDHDEVLARANLLIARHGLVSRKSWLCNGAVQGPVRPYPSPALATRAREYLWGDAREHQQMPAWLATPPHRSYRGKPGHDRQPNGGDGLHRHIAERASHGAFPVARNGCVGYSEKK
jgi:hypothetical protein